MRFQTKAREFIERRISERANFEHRSMSARWFSPRQRIEDGMLPSQFVKVLREHSESADLYVVYSFKTPIAWFSLNDSDSKGMNKWYMPNTKYSAMTTAHQNITKRGIQFSPNSDLEMLDEK